MEEAEVKQLISLIESAQLQYEVDESGTVSIVCDPVQLAESVGIDAIDDDASITTGNLLDTHNEVAEISSLEEPEKNVVDNISMGESVLSEATKELEETRQIELDADQFTNTKENGEEDINQPAESSSPIHYFLQTSNGQFIQVLDSLTDVADNNGGDIDQSLGGITADEDFPNSMERESTAEENMQILVVSNDMGEDMFLIKAADQQPSQDTKVTMDVSDGMLKNAETDTSMECVAINKDLDEMESLTSIPEEKIPDRFLKDPSRMFFEVAMLDEEVKSTEVTPETCKPQKKTTQKRNKCTRDKNLLESSRSVRYVNLDKPQKPNLQIVPVDNVSATLPEGSVVMTDKGDMVALSLSSVTNEQHKRKRSALNNLATSFGSLVKVLRPVSEELAQTTPDTINDVKKSFPLFPCQDCEVILHSERSLKIHRRRFHEEWRDECFICGRKFLNQHCVRNHMKETHSKDNYFECRHCSFRCSLLKEFYKHCRVHKKVLSCDLCGKRFTTQKMLNDHVFECRSKQDDNVGCNNTNISDCDIEPIVTDVTLNDNGRLLKSQPQVGNSVSIRQKAVSGEHNNRKRDNEYKVESKHYSQQLKKMALEKSSETRGRSRARTIRCYLCFKNFLSKADLDSHKEVYHHLKSSHPVRVKTDDTLGEEEDDTLEKLVKGPINVAQGLDEELQIKTEPPDINERLENVTIILDEDMNLSQLIKAECIACKANTKVDYKDSCRILQNISQQSRLEVLKSFEKFFPCIINIKSMVEPWVLCKKCSLLIERITDLEEKISSVRRDLVSRLKGNNQISDEEKRNFVDSCTIKREHISDKSSGNAIEGDSRDIQKTMFDIESFMKENCEIMEIIRPPARRGRQKQEVERFAPVLLNDDDDQTEFTQLDFKKPITKKLEEEDVVKNKKTFKENHRDNVKNEMDEGSAGKISENKYTDIKNEPLQHDPNSGLSRAVSDAGISAQIPIQMSRLDSEQIKKKFLLTVSKTKTNPSTNSDLFSAQILSEKEGCEVSQKTMQKANVNIPLDLMDHRKDGNIPEVNEMKDKQQPVPFDLTSSSQDKLFVKVEVVKTDNGKIKDCFKSQDVPVKDQKENTSAENSVQKEHIEQCGMKRIILPSSQSPNQEKEIDLGIQKSPKSTIVVGKKRAMLREERKKMCYQAEGNTSKPWNCRSCHKGFASQRGACDHYAASHGGQSFSCEYCSCSYVRKRDLIGHLNKVHLNAKPYKCKKCPDTFSTHSDLYRHLQNAHLNSNEDKEFLCHICGASYAQKRYRDAHVLICESKDVDAPSYPCTLCDKFFKLERYLHIHMKKVHLVNNDMFYCEICNKVLNDKRNLIVHMKSHVGETKVSCEVCHKQFSRKSYLWTHMRVHTNERPYGCNYCAKWFRQYSTWKNHERTHTGEKPYKCNLCDARFATNSSASKHLQYAHYDIRNFTCFICEKCFISKNKLTEHMKTHTGERPFKCHVCGRAFSKKTNLTTHMYIHSNTKRFKCELCGEGFMRRSAIETHLFERHKDMHVILEANLSDAYKSTADVVTAATSSFISVIKAEETNSEDTYIVLYPDEKNAKEESDKTVTVLAEDIHTNTISTEDEHLQLSVVEETLDSSPSHDEMPNLMIKNQLLEQIKFS